MIKMKYGRFFEIPSSSLLADEFRFLSRAVPDDISRYFMNQIKIEADFSAVSMDGRRLHLVKRLHKAADEVYGIEPGLYSVKKAAGKYLWLVQVLEDGGDFPTYERVIPKDQPVWEWEFYGLSERKKPGEMFNFFFHMPRPIPINLQYLRDLGDHCFRAKVFAEGKHAVVFESDTRKAVIMSMNYEGAQPAWLIEPVSAAEEVPA